MVVNVLANDSDVDGDTLSITAANSSNGAVSFAGSNITFTPAQDFNGPALVTYTISDGNGNSDSANLTVDVQADNDAPVAADDSANTNEDNDVIIDVLHPARPNSVPFTIHTKLLSLCRLKVSLCGIIFRDLTI